MRVVVCVKHVPDSTIVKFDIISKSLQNVYYIMDPIDEISVSEALKIREKNGGDVTTLTLGPPRANEVLRTCLKMGADRAIHLIDDGSDVRDPTSTASILGAYIAKLPYDIILCGNESMDQANGYVGVGIAELLGLPLVTSVTRIDIFADTNSATVHRRLKAGDREIVETPLPALFTVDTVLTKPVYPKLRTILAGQKKEIETVEAASLAAADPGADSAFGEPTISQPKPRLKKTATISSSLSPHERMKLIASGGVQDKGSSVVKKPPAQAAAEIIQFLINNGIISKKT
jgi:electron transfer flavoprotein beta subunit